jgi:hypothetical protein
MWDDIKAHRIASALFLAYWLFVLGLDLFRWHKPPDRPVDILPVVIYLHLLLAPVAGGLVSYWRRDRRARTAGGMQAGAAVLVIDMAAILGAQFIEFYNPNSPPSGESPFELPPLFIALALFGSLLGLLGAGIAAALWRSRRPVSVEVADPYLPSRTLWTAAALAAGVAVFISVGIIPALDSSSTAGYVLHGAGKLFALNAGLNLLIAAGLAALVRYRGGPAARILAVVAGAITLILGTELLGAASAGTGVLLVFASCVICAAADVTAGMLAVWAASRGAAMPV